LVDAVRLGTAAGTLNVTRRGFASGSRQEIESLAHHVDVRPRACS
jgi:1-phosphofructokinase